MPGTSASDVTYNNLSSGLIADDVQDAIDELAESTTPDDAPTSGSTNPITSGAVYTALSNKQNKLTFDNTPVSGSNNPVKSGGLYTALSGKQNALTFDSTPISGSNNPVKSGGIYTALAGKQNALTFDNAPTANSTNPVRSNGIYTALAGKQNALTFDNAPTANSTNPVTSNGIYQAIANKQGALVFDSVPISGSTNPVRSNGIYTALAEKANSVDIPSKYTSTPTMNGTGFAGNSGKYADGNHVHPIDTSRVPTSRKINGYDLTQDRTLTAADVGALASNGTAVAAQSANTLAVMHNVNGAASWRKFLELTVTYGGGNYIELLVKDTFGTTCGIVSIVIEATTNPLTTSNTSVKIMWLHGVAMDDIRFSIDGLIVTFYINKRGASSGVYQFIVLSSTVRGGGYYSIPSSAWKNESVTLSEAWHKSTGIRAQYDANGNQINTTYLTTTGTAAKATADNNGNSISEYYTKRATQYSATPNGSISLSLGTKNNRELLSGMAFVVDYSISPPTVDLYYLLMSGGYYTRAVRVTNNNDFEASFSYDPVSGLTVTFPSTRRYVQVDVFFAN